MPTMKLEDLNPSSQAECRLALRLGYHPVPDTRRGRGWYKFMNNDRTIWLVRDMQWQTADMYLGQYTNHQKFPTLAEALHRPLTEATDGTDET